jgi:MFS family permease
MNEERKRFRIHWAWVILGSGFITQFINFGIQNGAYPILLPEMIRDIGINMNQAAMIRTGYFFTYVFFSPLMGWLTDRTGGRLVISSSCLLLGMGTFLMGYASTLFLAILFHGIVGMGAAAMWTSVVTLIQRWFGDARRGLALGILTSSAPLGFGLMGVLLPLVVRSYSWRMGWFLLGISGLILAVINAFFLKNNPQDIGLYPWGETSESIQPSLTFHSSFNYRDVFTWSGFWLIGTSYLFMTIGTFIIGDFIVTYGVMELKVSYTVASAFISIMAITGIAGGLVLMSLSDRTGRKRLLVIIHSLVTSSILLIILAGNNISLLRVGIGSFGFFYGAVWPMYAACARDYFSKEISGTVIGTFTLFFGIGAMTGPILAGYLTDVTGTFRWSFGLGAFTCFVAALLIGFLERPKNSEGLKALYPTRT